MRENLTSGSGRGRWKHDLSRAKYMRVTSAPAAYSTPGLVPLTCSLLLDGTLVSPATLSLIGGPQLIGSRPGRRFGPTFNSFLILTGR